MSLNTMISSQIQMKNSDEPEHRPEDLAGTELSEHHGTTSEHQVDVIISLRAGRRTQRNSCASMSAPWCTSSCRVWTGDPPQGALRRRSG